LRVTESRDFVSLMLTGEDGKDIEFRLYRDEKIGVFVTVGGVLQQVTLDDIDIRWELKRRN
jgi:hypothetical protein